MTDPIQLFPDQERAVEDLRDGIRRGVTNQVLCAPTGSGKTVVATYIISAAREKGTRCVFVADRVALIDQTSAVLDRFGISHGVIQADHWRWRPWERVQVASAQTLARRGWPDDVGLIVVDECHTVHKPVVRQVAKRECVTIGLTATPFTRGLGRYYDRVVSVTTTTALIEAGRLSPYRIFAASEPDMKGAKVSAGEWTDREAEARSIPIVGDIVQEYLRHGAGKKFIAFGATIAHCEEIQRQFMASGVICSLYTSHTPDEERTEMVREFRSPTSYIRGLISVAALAKGFDVEDVGCIIMARPLRSSLAEHLQIFGRGLRRDPGDPSKQCTILDHSGNCVRFWDATLDFFDNGAGELDDGKPKPKKDGKPKPKEPRKCSQCAHVHAPLPSCPQCGFEYPRKTSIETIDGELQELSGGASRATSDEKREVYAMLLHVARSRQYKDGWAAHKYRTRFGVWPATTFPRDRTVPPSMDILRWVHSEQIRNAKRRTRV